MARRRLSPPAAPGDPSASPAGAPESKAHGAAPDRRPSAPALSAPTLSAPRPPGPAPIARVAGEAALAAAETARAAARLAAAEAEGRLLADIPLGAIDAGHLERDRHPSALQGEEMAALVASIRAGGQRTPAEVVDLGPEAGARRYGLISGWRRLAALSALAQETGEPRFAVLRAVVRGGDGAGEGDRGADPQAYVAMVEENEIRAGLSYVERARIADLAARRGAFDSAEAAIDVLFAAGSRAKRSKIRSFLAVHRALGARLRHPAAINERLGLKLAEALKGQGAAAAAAALLVALDALPRDRDAAQELAALTAALAEIAAAERPAPGPPRSGDGPEPRTDYETLAPGLLLCTERGPGWARFELRGAALPEAAIDAAQEALRMLPRHFAIGTPGGAPDDEG